MKRNLFRDINFDSRAKSLLFEPFTRFFALKTGSVDFRNDFFILFLLKLEVLLAEFALFCYLRDFILQRAYLKSKFADARLEF